ncbi:uncharacterized protein LOC112533938 isoform X2 [Ricinus communis]|uniref:uncharacterized protein LOC112533938 isoform X2 n=1 Tax=Ricinus communis TaxID=3988 RepID=UPI000D69B182|nr:uncharacterized protein LOC112533938 isoform X2 [Ricinus communis]|eukprot:XP_025012163.1 uncharacterized protein LOC112533938 isoform X2 [Ricinus communis]
MGYISEKNLFYRGKSLLSSLCRIILWSTTLPSSMQVSKQCWAASPGLKTLIHPRDPTHHPLIIHSCKRPSPPSPMLLSPSLSTTSSSSLFQSVADSSPYSSWSSMLDDLIGTESGVCLNSGIEERATIMWKHEAGYHPNHGKRDQQQCEKRKRLILREERLEHHEYFESYRENGRLILKLIRIPFDDIAYDDEEEELELQELELIQEEKTQESTEEEEEEEEDEIDVYTELVHENLMATSASSIPKSYLKNGSEIHGDVCKCFSTYAGKMVSESYLPCNANAQRKCEGYMDQSSSATSLTLTIRPMTTVV